MEGDEFDDGFDENLMGDEEDRRKLAQMTEKEREQELFNRSERREMLKIRFEIGRKLKNKRNLEKQSKQARANKRLRASEVYSSDDSSEDSDEYTPDTDKSSGPNDTQSSKMNTRASALLMSSSSESSASSASSSASSSESEHENDDLDRDEDSRHAQDDFQMTLADLRSIQLRRERIEQWVYSRFFDEAAKDLFVKISVGNHSITKQHMYKVAQITKIIEGQRVYPLNINGTTKTKKQCIVNIGGTTRTFNMSFISNRGFDEEDYIKWRDQVNADGQGMPNRELFLRKRRELEAAMNHAYTDEDIVYEIAERSKYKEHPNNFALKKSELMAEKREAEAANEFERAREIQQQVDELEEKAKELEKSRSSSTFSAISFVNERNRIKNIEESERVLKESKSVKTEDPFTRRKCTPQIVHNRNNQSDLNSKNEDKTSNGAGGRLNGAGSKSTDTPDGANRANAEPVNDLFQAHASIDLDIDI